MGKQQQHFLLVAAAAPGQINPTQHLARLLARTTGSRATIATPISSHRRMFPPSSHHQHQELLITDCDHELVSFAAYSDAYDQGFHQDTDDGQRFLSQLKLVGSQSLNRLAVSLADLGRPVTCVVYTIFTEWAAAVAADIGVPAVLHWIQPAAVFTVYHRYFHGYAHLISAHKDDPSFTLDRDILPGLPALQIKDIPSYLTEHSSTPYLGCFRDIMLSLLDEDRVRGRKSRVLISTFHELEARTVEAAADDNFEFITVGPPALDAKRADMWEKDDEREYMAWLDEQDDGSVVYVSFGGICRHEREQVEEIWRGLKESRRRYLWVIREDVREKIRSGGRWLMDRILGDDEGMVVGWCDQIWVLMHRSVGCFLTHGGWGSVTESISCGVPMVVLPGWSDQLTVAKMVEGVWRNGVRADVSEGRRVMEGVELRRCLDVVMGEGERGEGIRLMAELWKDRAREAGKLAERNIASFVDNI